MAAAERGGAGGRIDGATEGHAQCCILRRKSLVEFPSVDPAGYVAGALDFSHFQEAFDGLGDDDELRRPDNLFFNVSHTLEKRVGILEITLEVTTVNGEGLLNARIVPVEIRMGKIKGKVRFVPALDGIFHGDGEDDLAQPLVEKRIVNRPILRICGIRRGYAFPGGE